MDLKKDPVRSLFFKFWRAAFGSAMIASVYGIVDMAMVGQYQGPDGVAALAVFAPIWNIIYSLGLLTGTGGSILLAFEKSRGDEKRANGYFTKSLILSVILAAFAWIATFVWAEPILRFFGANDVTLPLALEYLKPLRYVFPAYLFNQMLAAFLRNDNVPALATKATIIGGLFNVVGDYVLVFTFKLGIFGAGVATAVGSMITLSLMVSHFFSKKCTLKLAAGVGEITDYGKILNSGFSTFITDVAMGIVTIFFNRQIMRYMGTDALAVYGVIVNISTIVQSCSYSIGQAAQPLLTVNFGAGLKDRMKAALKYSLYTAGIFAVLWTSLVWIFPNFFIRVFMTPTNAILEIAPAILRRYGLSFLILPFNIYSIFHFQSVLRPGTALVVSMGRGIIISSIMILCLPLLAPSAIWFAMPVTELLVAIYAYTKLRTTMLSSPDR